MEAPDGVHGAPLEFFPIQHSLGPEKGIDALSNQLRHRQSLLSSNLSKPLRLLLLELDLHPHHVVMISIIAIKTVRSRRDSDRKDTR